MSSAQIHDALKSAEPAFRTFLESSTKLDWKLKKLSKTGEGETLVTWESDKGSLTFVTSMISAKTVSMSLHYNHANGDPEQPKVGRVSIEKVDDPKATLGNLLGKYKGKVDWDKKGSLQDALNDFKGVLVARNVAARFARRR